MNSSAEYSGSSGVNGYAYAIGASLGVLVLIIIISLAAYFCTRGVDSSAPTATNQVGSITDHDFIVMELGDYKDSDVLRLLPDCGHVFHLKCVDCWIRRHPTCPICRNSCSSMPTPLSTPLAEVAPLAVSRH
ncbi:hypothetical protein OIU84_020162 [Salix udensis]|uniref:RING-type domain-containing protein n=1 Tax=Salix udensis TaxID=889485 RepID=A0AAD6PL67_9ROSI|nr:hypothetical protein OIU84_020162 [Salix udensis]